MLLPLTPQSAIHNLAGMNALIVRISWLIKVQLLWLFGCWYGNHEIGASKDRIFRSVYLNLVVFVSKTQITNILSLRGTTL